MSKIVNKPITTNNEMVNVRRAAIEQRGRWAAAFYLEAKKDGIDLEPIMRRAVRNIGIEAGKKEKAAFNKEVTAQEYGRYFCTKAMHETFDKQIVKDEEEFECTLNYCPLLKAWQEMGCDDETCAMLCDIAMEGDRGIAEGLGFDFDLKSSLAKGDKNCHLCYKNKK